MICYPYPMVYTRSGFTTWGKVLRFIAEHYDRTGLSPVYREICAGLNVHSTSTIAHHVEFLIARGYLTRIEKSPRSLLVTGKGREVLAPKKVTDENTS